MCHRFLCLPFMSFQKQVCIDELDDCGGPQSLNMTTEIIKIEFRAGIEL